MGTRRWACGLAVSSSLALLSVASASAAILGGGPVETDCWAYFDAPAANYTGIGLACADGDSSCDTDGAVNGSCLIPVRLCFGLPDAGSCAPEPIARVDMEVTRPAETIAAPEPGAQCGPQALVNIRGRGPVVANVVVETVAGALDVDRLELACIPVDGSWTPAEQLVLFEAFTSYWPGFCDLDEAQASLSPPLFHVLAVLSHLDAYKPKAQRRQLQRLRRTTLKRLRARATRMAAVTSPACALSLGPAVDVLEQRIDALLPQRDLSARADPL